MVFLTKAMEGYAFFNVEHKHGGLTAIVFNTNHPFYDDLIKSLDSDVADEPDADLLARIHRAADTVELLFAAWGALRNGGSADSRVACSRCGKNGGRWRGSS